MTVVRETVREEARRGNAVIVGRGGAWILAGEPGVFHVRLVGDREDRIARIADRLGLTLERATTQVDETDRDRCNYLKHNFGNDWREPHHFHVVINTSKIGATRAADMVAGLITGGIS
jgi:cytidylate kinase